MEDQLIVKRMYYFTNVLVKLCQLQGSDSIAFDDMWRMKQIIINVEVSVWLWDGVRTIINTPSEFVEVHEPGEMQMKKKTDDMKMETAKVSWKRMSCEIDRLVEEAWGDGWILRRKKKQSWIQCCFIFQ